MIANPLAPGALLTSAATPPSPPTVCAALSVGAVNQLRISGVAADDPGSPAHPPTAAAGVVLFAVAALPQLRTRRRFRP
jgi:MYXO-CTERM domain-containing protein